MKKVENIAATQSLSPTDVTQSLLTDVGTMCVTGRKGEQNLMEKDLTAPWRHKNVPTLNSRWACEQRSAPTQFTQIAIHRLRLDALRPDAYTGCIFARDTRFIVPILDTT